jgi:Leucine-rich repeat (LRR) protein
MEYIFDIEDHINSLPDDTKEIRVDGKNLQDIPSLARFKQLESLSCCCNQLRKLPQLPENIKNLYCSFNQLQILPELPEKLTRLFCNHNQLVTLPHLPEKLEHLLCDFNQLQILPDLPEKLGGLFCNNNQLVTLPRLPQKLERLFCNSNQLRTLPHLPQKLESLFCRDNQLDYFPLLNKKLQTLWHGWCVNNPIYEILYNRPDNNIDKIRIRIQKLYNFRHLYYSLKFKKQFKYWIWAKVREPKIILQYNPSNLFNNLDDDDDLDEFLQNY